MKAEDLIELGEDPRFIPGIYNYCDYWCERCAFTSRCLSYAQDRANFDEDDPESHELDPSKVVEKLRETFRTAKELALKGAAKWGIDVNSLEPAEEELAEYRRREKEAREEPLTEFAKRYGFMVKDWFERERDAVEIAYQQSHGTANDILPEELENAVEVIRWYQFMPVVKLYRGARFDDDDEIEEYRKDDMDGSVKVALIAMDRSILAWDRMREFLPQEAESIRPILAHLEELREWAEREFPDARSFVRPGFDEVIDHVM